MLASVLWSFIICLWIGNVLAPFLRRLEVLASVLCLPSSVVWTGEVLAFLCLPSSVVCPPSSVLRRPDSGTGPAPGRFPYHSALR